MRFFHFTLGPVQDFVAQARRSKDLWAGSFLLSWLSAVAILAVRNQGDNTIQFPLPNEAFLDAVSGKPTLNPPKQGGIPNRFKGMVVQVEDDFEPEGVIHAVQQAWQSLAQLVWDNDVLPALSGSEFNVQDTQQVWQRQVDGFWDISWVLTEDADASNLLDRRKNWRSHYRAPEPGDKCMVMSGFQELSGAVRPGKTVYAFWQNMRNQCAFGDRDFSEQEQLCALAFIKRRFARYFDQLDVQLNCGGNHTMPLKGWAFSRKVEETYDPNHVPSLPYLAALPWLNTALQCVQDAPELDASFQRFAQASADVFGLPSANVEFDCLIERDMPLGFTALDGSGFFPESLAASKAYKAEDLSHLTRAFNDFKRDAQLPACSPFYAVLLMDGDSLGVQMSTPEKQKPISAALNAFTQGVPEIVAKHNGFLCYAGGDDVLAFMPFDSVIECAYALKNFYNGCIADHAGGSGLFSTLSGAIQFAHMKTPLMQIISQAHGLLDDVAKDQTGRDSLAIRINKPGGVHAQWSMPWTAIYHDGSCLDHAVDLLGGGSTLSTGVLYKLMSLLERFNGEPDQILKLAVAEYCQSDLGINAAQAEEILLAMFDVCAVKVRNSETGDVNFKGKWNYDGLKLVRFLACKGIEGEQA